MMIKLFLTIFFVFLGVFVQADTSDDIQALKSMTPKVCHFSGEFTQSKQIKTLPVPLISNGEFVYSCDLGLIWKTQKPIVESLVFTNQKLHFLVLDKYPAENLEGVQHDFLANLLLGLMSGNTDFIIKEFELLRTENDQGFLTLKPKNKMVKRAIESVTLKKPSDKNALEIIITDKNQQSTKIISSETQQFTDKSDFSKKCSSFASRSCEFLLNPVRIIISGKN